ncbi:MAG: stage II sporulation protein D [Halanaerobacter sp.]
MILINLIETETEITVYDYKLQEEKKLDLEDYLKGVVAAEMPVSFPLEALKAQAVAARTYALKKKVKRQRLTTDSKFDQAWLSEEELAKKWQNDFLVNWAKVAAAVEETKGLVLTYNNQLITAAYHSTSGGQTAPAVEVWGSEVPYLKSVNSYCEAASPYYKEEEFFSWSELAQKLAASKGQEVEIIERSSSQRVLKIKINGEIFSGREFRKKLALNSTKFDYIESREGLKFIVDGFGHGVGMSQYGAQGLAHDGHEFREILKHYYPGVKIAEKSNLDV